MEAVLDLLPASQTRLRRAIVGA